MVVAVTTPLFVQTLVSPGALNLENGTSEPVPPSLLDAAFLPTHAIPDAAHKAGRFANLCAGKGTPGHRRGDGTAAVRQPPTNRPEFLLAVTASSGKPLQSGAGREMERPGETASGVDENRVNEIIAVVRRIRAFPTLYGLRNPSPPVIDVGSDNTSPLLSTPTTRPAPVSSDPLSQARQALEERDFLGVLALYQTALRLPEVLKPGLFGLTRVRIFGGRRESNRPSQTDPSEWDMLKGKALEGLGRTGEALSVYLAMTQERMQDLDGGLAATDPLRRAMALLVKVGNVNMAIEICLGSMSSKKYPGGSYQLQDAEFLADQLQNYGQYLTAGRLWMEIAFSREASVRAIFRDPDRILAQILYAVVPYYELAINALKKTGDAKTLEETKARLRSVLGWAEEQIAALRKNADNAQTAFENLRKQLAGIEVSGS